MSESIIEPPFSPTPETIVNIAIERMQAQYPNWNPNPASPEYRKFLAFAAIVSEVLVLAFDVPEAIIRFVGAAVYQVPLTPATFATATSTWTAKDTLGHKIPTGTIVLITPEGKEPLAFEVTKEVEIPVGASATAVGAVPLQALEAGSEGNIAGAASTATLENLSWVALVSSSAAVGGEEEETIEEYTRRVLELARLIAPRPILPEDFANFARLLVKKEKILRAVAVDGLQLEVEGGHTKVNGSGEGTQVATGQERCVTVFAMNQNGEHLSTPAREEAEALLKAAREVSFKVFVAGPSINTINVVIAGKTFKGWTPAVVEANLQTALKEYLSAKNWGGPPHGEGGWINRKTLRYQDIITLLNNTEGFNFYTSLQLNVTEGDIALTGLAPIPVLGTIAITLAEGTE